METEYSTYEEDVMEVSLDANKSLGSPIIVQALSRRFSSLNVPGTLKDDDSMDVVKNVSGSEELFDDVYMKDTENENAACVIVAESINPSDTSKVEESFENSEEQSQAPPFSCTPKKKNKRKKQKSHSNDSPRNMNNLNDEVIQHTPSTVVRHENTSNIIDSTLSRFYSMRDKVIVVMDPASKFCFSGKLSIKVISGAIEVYGSLVTRLTGSTDVYSPRGHSYVAVKTSSHSEDVDSDIWTHLEVEGVDPNAETRLKDDIDQRGPGTAVIALTNIENKLTKFLNKFYPLRVFPKIDDLTTYSWTDPRRAEVILQSNLYFGALTCKHIEVDRRVTTDVTLKMLNRWKSGNWACTLIAGGKSVGKSTTARYLINSLLPTSKKVVLLDLDIGQTECTPAGCVSYSLIQEPLLGPNFTHLQMPVYQLYIGDVNVSKCITRYIEAVKKLFDKLSSCPTLSRLPIVINTMGFCKGIGWDILVFIIKLVRPSLILQINSKTAKNNFQEYLSSEVIDRQSFRSIAWGRNIIDWKKPCSHELCVISSEAEKKLQSAIEMWNMEPYQHRDLVLLSYLSEIAQYSQVSYRESSCLSINAATPYMISFSSVYIALPQTYVPPTHVFSVINGNIVALCGFDSRSANRGDSTQCRGVLIRPPLCTCYGFGIVRGVDMDKEKLYINTALPLSIMQFVNCLVGCIPLPTTLLNVDQPGAPYVGGYVDLPTSREHRRGYFRMRNQNNTQKSS